MKVKELKKGEWFTKKPIEYPSGMQVWIRDEYDKSERKYLCYCWGDINKWCYIKGDKEVYIDFMF